MVLSPVILVQEDYPGLQSGRWKETLFQNNKNKQIMKNKQQQKTPNHGPPPPGRKEKAYRRQTAPELHHPQNF